MCMVVGIRCGQFMWGLVGTYLGWVTLTQIKGEDRVLEGFCCVYIVSLLNKTACL